MSNVRENAADYTIIRAEDAPSIVRTAVSLALSAIKDATGEKLSVSEDWVEDKKSDYEILIGTTNRPESAEAMKQPITLCRTFQRLAF